MKKIVLIILGIVGIFASLIIFTCVVIFSVLNNQKNADFYKMGDDQIPSVKYVVGERNISGVSQSTENGVQTKVYKYHSDSIPDDIEQYTKYLVENENFLNETYMQDSSYSMYYKSSNESGKILIIYISNNMDGYTITIQKQKGTVPEIK